MEEGKPGAILDKRVADLREVLTICDLRSLVTEWRTKSQGLVYRQDYHGVVTVIVGNRKREVILTNGLNRFRTYVALSENPRKGGQQSLFMSNRAGAPGGHELSDISAYGSIGPIINPIDIVVE